MTPTQAPPSTSSSGQALPRAGAALSFPYVSVLQNAPALLGSRGYRRDWASSVRAAVKRGIDVVFASLLLLAVSPIFAVLAIAIKLESPGPVFYRAPRVGYRGRALEMLKFRKMSKDATGLALTAHADVRFTRIGAFLARTKLDELPQLWNVLRGDMSVIGPRPEDPGFVIMHADEYADILQIRPGMTGLSQIAFAEESRILDEDDPVGHYVGRILPQKMTLDRMYARHYHLRIDLSILVWTSIAVLARRPIAVNRSTGSMRLRTRPADGALLRGLGDTDR